MLETENLAYLPSVSASASGSVTEPFYYVNGYQGTDVATAKASANYQTYGAFYNWPASLTACPTGWHLPSQVEWNTLITFLGGTSSGGTMKEIGITHWNDPNVGATNSSGLTMRGAGFRWMTSNGTFENPGLRTYHWSSTESSPNAYHLGLFSSGTTTLMDTDPKDMGFSVRCLKD